MAKNSKELKPKKKSKGLNPYVMVILSFIIVIFIGSFLLTTPLAQSDGAWAFNHVRADGERVTYMDCLFNAVSATCVTGLCTFRNGIGNTLSLFGQIVMLVMIQIGGLGFITVLTFFVTLFQTKLQFKDRYFISQMVGSTNFADVVRFVRKLILISISFVIAGTILGIPVFLQLPHKHFGEVLWNSLFTSASAFNNAGFDLFGSTSLIKGMGNELIDKMPAWAYYYMCTYIMFLIISGGISFLVIIDVFVFNKHHRQWRAFTKIVLSTTGVLLAAGWILFIATECFHSDGMNVYQALFQSVTLRTAGFATYNQDNMSLVGKAISCILMFIGGSPLSTAGGIKTTTAFMIVLAMFSYFRGRQVTAFKRTYSTNMIVKAMSLVFIGLFIVLFGYLLIVAFEANNEGLLNGLSSEKNTAIIYETFSAFGTVGVSTGITPNITIGSKIVLCLLMFLGRLGPITFLQIFQANMDKKQSLHYHYVEEDFLIG